MSARKPPPKKRPWQEKQPDPVGDTLKDPNQPWWWRKVVGPAVVMSRTPTAVQRAAPALGEHSAQILIEAGCPPEEVAKLCTEGVLVQR